MSVPFNQIPGNVRTPGVFIEFDPSRAGALSASFRMLLLGQMLDSGTAAADVPVGVTRVDQAKVLFESGSMLARMCETALSDNKTVEIIAIPQADPDGVAATGAVAIDGDVASSGVFVVVIGGDRVPVRATKGVTSSELAVLVAAAVTSNANLLVSAAVDGSDSSRVIFTAKNKGVVGNDIEISYYWDVRLTPSAPTFSMEQMAGGSGSADLTASLTAMGDTQYNWIAMPYVDSVSLAALEVELLDRWGPMDPADGRAFCAYRGNHAESVAKGNSRNPFYVTMLAVNESPRYTPICAASYCAVVAGASEIDPARPFQTLALPSVLAPPPEKRFRRQEREILLNNGMSTITVDDDGTVRINRAITMYQTNDAGFDDAAYLDLNTPETLSRIRYRQRAHFSTNFPRHKLAADGTDYPPGQAIVTPSIIKGQFIALYEEFVRLGWVENPEAYAESLIVEIDEDDKNRVNVMDRPNLANQFRVLAAKTQFEV